MDAAQYAIEIASKMTGAERTDAALDALTAKLSGGGRDAKHFQDAISQVGSQLTGAASASKAANEALADGTAAYRQLEMAALKASKAEEKSALAAEQVTAAVKGLEYAQNQLGVALEDDVGGEELAKYAASVAKAESRLNKLRSAAGSLDRNRSAAVAASAAVSKYKIKLEGLEIAAKQASAAQDRLSRASTNLARLNKRVTDRVGDAATKLSTFRGALGDVGGPLGELGERLLFPVQALVDLNEWFGRTAAIATVAVVGFAAIAAAIVVVGAVAAAAAVGVAALAIKLADSRRSADLTQAALEQMSPILVTLRGDFAKLRGDTNLTDESLRGLTKSLQGAKIAAAEMPAALRAAALAEAALEQGGAQQFIDQMEAGKLSVQEFAIIAEQKFGGIVARKMLGLETQGARLKSNLAGLFGGLKIEGALKGLRTLVAMFDRTSVIGRVIAAVFEGIFQPLIDQAQLAAYVVEAFVLGVLIGLAKMYIAAKPAIKAVTELFGFETPELETMLRSVTKAGEYLAPVLVGLALGLGASALAIGSVIAVVGVALLPLFAALVGSSLAVVNVVASLAAVFVAVRVSAYNFAAAVVGAVSGAVSGAVEWLTGLVATVGSIGGDIMSGLAAGITGSAGKIVSAMGGAVQGAINHAKSLLGIASPSKVFAQIGGYTGEGFADGIERETGAAQDALADLVEPPLVESPLATAVGVLPGASSGAPSPEGSGAGGGAGSGASVMSGATLNFYGVENAEQAADRIGEVVTLLLEGDLAQLGKAVAA